jgi:acetyl-CoA carboxylase biotin carboxyl carrier protein
VDLTNEDVADILALLDSLPYDELDLRTPRFRLTLRRAADGGWTQESRILSEPVPVPQSPIGSPPDNGPPPDNNAPPDNGPPSDNNVPPSDNNAPPPDNNAPDISEKSGEDDAGGGSGVGSGSDAEAGLVAVTAPLPGTFYRAPRPGAPPFVEVGDLVREDTVVAIVETMKLMNSVPAGTRGRVARICLDNAESVARGVTLMLIEPEPS